MLFLVVGADIKLQLEKYLLKTVCSDVTNLILDYMSQENLVYSDQDLATWTFEVRVVGAIKTLQFPPSNLIFVSFLADTIQVVSKSAL